MSFLKTSLSISSLVAILLVSGCSDLFQKKEVSKKFNSQNAVCELNVDDFSNIMEENISSSIDCLGANLQFFITRVESKKPGYLSRKALENYLKRNRREVTPEVLRALKAVFDINFLVYGEDREYISSENVNALVNFAKIFNVNAATNFKPIFMSDATITYEQFRSQRDERIKPASTTIADALKDIFKRNRKGQVHELNITGLLDSFTTGNNEESIAKVKKLLFIKKILLGGTKDTITHEELFRLIENFSSYTLLSLDLMKFKKVEGGQESKLQLIYSDLELVNNLIFSSSLPNREKERLFTLREAVTAAQVIMKDKTPDFDKYYDLLKEAKLLLMEGNPSTPENVTGADLRRLFSHGLKVLKTGTLFHRFWRDEKEVLESSRPITADFREFIRDNNETSDERERVKDFVRIVKDYRFMKGKFKSAYYTDDYKRSADAVYEIAIYEYGLKLLMKKFGCPNNTLGGTVVCNTIPTEKQAHWGKDYVYMQKEHVVDMVRRFRKVLIGAGLILPGREVKTAETITLLGSLFQYQSDKNKVFDVNEASEFAISLFTSTKVAKDLNTYFTDLEKQNRCDIDRFGRISPECLKGRFFRGVCLNYPDQFPKLFSSLGATVYEADPERPGSQKLVCRIPEIAPNVAYLERAIKAARSCHVYPETTEEIFYSKGDVMSVFLAMMHIETTIIRWDVRHHNNYMDADEVMDAYTIYSPALDGFLKKMPPLVQRLKKQIYQFLVKYEKVPDAKEFSSIFRFVRFLLSFDKEAPANRKTIASILVTIGENGTPSAFDCGLLRNPDNIPENYDPPIPPVNATPASAPMSLSNADAELADSIELESDQWVERQVEALLP